MREWRANHPGYAGMKSAEWRFNNLERKRELERKYYAANPQSYKRRQKEYYLKTLEKFVARSVDWSRKNHEKVILRAAKSRAKKRGLEFNLDVGDIVIPKVCPILGIPIVRVAGKRLPGSASLDRIDNSRGYVKDNVWVISSKANLMKNNATTTELLAFGKWALSKLNHIEGD